MAKLSKEDLEQALAVFRAGDQSVCVPVCSKFIVNIIEWLLKLETRNAELEKQLDAGDKSVFALELKHRSCIQTERGQT